MSEAELLAHDHWSRQEVLASQCERLQALITYAVTCSPYYREALGAEAVDRPFAELPTLSKSTMMDEFDGVVTDPRLRLADLQAHLGGPDPSQSFLGACRVATTSVEVEPVPALKRQPGGKSGCAIGLRKINR